MELTKEPAALSAGKTASLQLRDLSLRAEQLAKVAEAERARLMLVCAPAGYGKTTLVAAGAGRFGWQHVWYRLDATDDEPLAFFRSLADAMRLCGAWPDEMPAWHATSTDDECPPSLLATSFVQPLERADLGQLFIVLDDYDALECTEHFDDAMAALLHVLPPTIHLIVLSRRQPSFASARLDVEGGLAEITYRDLLLDTDQVSGVMEGQGYVAPTRWAVEELLRVTDGWAAGTVLAAKAMRGRSSAASRDALRTSDLQRAVYPYLAQEVYDKQPPEVRQFLRSTCCLDAMTGALAEAVTKSADAECLLEDLQKNGLFIFPDAGADAVRYHPLFRRFLQSQMAREEGADAYRTLQRLSAGALATHGFLAAAVGLYLALGDPQPPLAMLERHGTELLDRCDEAVLAQWVEALRQSPEAGDSGWMALVNGRRLLRSGHLESAREQLEWAHAALNGDQAGRYVALRALAQQRYVTGEDELAIEHAQEALVAAQGPHQVAESLVALARMLSTSGRWRELDEAVAAFNASGEAPPALAAEMASLEAHRTYIAGNVRNALTAAERALPLALRHFSKEDLARFLNGLANLSFLFGDYAEAARYLASAHEESVGLGAAEAAAELEMTRAALLAQEGDTAAALAALDELREAQSARDNAALRVEIHLVRGTVHRRSGRPKQAEKDYERALRRVASGGPLYDRLNVQIDLAFTLHLCDGDPQASVRLQRLMDEAAHARLLFQYAKARFYLAVILDGREQPSGADVVSPCEKLVRLGHLDFLAQELVAYPEAASALLAADIEDGWLGEALEAVACQAGGGALFAQLATMSERAGLLVVEPARKRLGAEGRRRLLAELRKHPSKRVRDLARHSLLSGARVRLFPELTPREEEILALLAEGATNQAIAERSSLSLTTVKTHVHRILTKLPADGRHTAAALYQQRSGLV